MANLGANPRLLLSPECNGGSPAAVACFASRPAERPPASRAARALSAAVCDVVSEGR